MKINNYSIPGYFSSIDPGYLALKRSFKTFLAILISVALFWPDTSLAMFAAISSMLFSRSQVGNTMTERRFTMLTTGILMALLSVPVTLASQNSVLAIIFVIIASFVIFFLIGNRVVPDFPAVSILALSVVEMAFSHTVESGLKFGGLFLLTTTLVYILHAVLWPTRPMKRLKAQIEIITTNMKDYNRSMLLEYSDVETAIKITQEKGDRVRKSLGDFRRLWQLFGVKIQHKHSLESRYLEIYTGLGKTYEFLLLMWQFRVNTWDSELYHKMIIIEDKVNKIVQNLIAELHPDILKPSKGRQKKLKESIQNLGQAYLQNFSKDNPETHHLEWVAVINTIKALEALIDDLERLETSGEIKLHEFSIPKKIQSFFRKSKVALQNLKTSNAGFRLGIRSAIIIGSCMAFSIYIEPDYGYWLVLFAVLLIRPNLGVSIKAGKERLLGTVAGSILALGFVWLVPPGHPIFYTFLLLSVFLMIWFINLERMIPMVTALTFMIICLFYLISPDESNLVWLRIYYTAAIVLFVIFLSFLLWPQKARKRFAGSLADALKLEQSFFKAIIHSILSGEQGTLTSEERQLIRDKIQQLNEVIDASKNEVLQEKVIIHGLNIRSYIMRLLNTLQALESSSRTCGLGTGFKDVSVELSNFSENITIAFDSLISALNKRTNINDFPDLSAHFEVLRKRFREIKYKDGMQGESITQFWNNSTFMWNLKPLMLELEGIKYEIEMKMEEV